jgi:hypothetical protein
MKLILMLLFFAKFSFAYQLYNKADFNITSSPEFREELCSFCGKFYDRVCPEELKDEDILECLEEIYWKILYCEPPKISSEKWIQQEISSEKWREVLQNNSTLLGLNLLEQCGRKEIWKSLK